MFRHCAYIKLFVAFSLTLFSSSAFAQVPATQTKEVATPEPKTGKPENKVAPRSNDLESDVANLKAENAAVKELLRKMEEQQRVLLEQVDRLQRRLDGANTAGVQPAVEQPLQTADGPPRETNAENATAQPTASPVQQERSGIYNDGIVIWETSEDARVPFQLKFTNTTQVRYLNTLSAKRHVYRSSRCGP